LVENIAGAPSIELVKSFINSALEQDKNVGLEAVGTASNQNADMKIFAGLIMKYLRFAMLASYAPNMLKNMEDELGEDEFEYIKTLAKHKNAKQLPNILKTMLEAHEELMYAHIKELPLELALVKIIEHNNSET